MQEEWRGSGSRTIAGGPHPIDFIHEERALYTRWRRGNVKPFYRDYAKVGLPVHGVGFILTIYRKRAASSWASVTKSFQRRREKLEEALENWGPNSIHMLFGSVALKDIIEQEEVEEGEEIEREGAIDEDLSKPNQRIDLDRVRGVVERERTVIEELLDELDDLRQRGVDSKRDALISHLKSIMTERRGVLVFSQYKDTVDDIAESMFYEFGSSMAKYHGSGGEVWDGGRFKLVKKEDVKKRIENGEFRLLIATDAASEGLNLQMMDAVVNYDLPWNPMRIEQRIGRMIASPRTSRPYPLACWFRDPLRWTSIRGASNVWVCSNKPWARYNRYRWRVIEDLVLGRDDIESGWGEIEDRWATAKEHALLFEEALSAQEFKGGWQERKDAERTTLKHLLTKVGYIEYGGVWERAGHRISFEGTKDGCDWMTALSHDRLFVALLSEMGQMPQELERDGLQYKVIESGGSMALAVSHSDGSVRLIKDLTDMEGANEEQVGTDWEAAIRDVNDAESDRRESFRRFRKEQGKVREKEWRRSVERDVIIPLLRSNGSDLDLSIERIVGDPVLNRLFTIYHEEGDVSRSSLLRTLRSVGTPNKIRGKPPSWERIIKNAEELIVQGRAFHRDS